MCIQNIAVIPFTMSLGLEVAAIRAAAARYAGGGELKLCGGIVVAVVWVTGAAWAQVPLPMMLSDHAVLQRGVPVHVWGWSSPEAHLTARFHKQTVKAQADALGKWSLYLAPEQAGGPYTLTVSGDGPDK